LRIGPRDDFQHEQESGLALADYPGRASASRAVAGAVARNPVGFRWGMTMKRMLLERETTL